MDLEDLLVRAAKGLVVFGVSVWAARVFGASWQAALLLSLIPMLLGYANVGVAKLATFCGLLLCIAYLEAYYARHYFAHTSGDDLWARVDRIVHGLR